MPHGTVPHGRMALSAGRQLTEPLLGHIGCSEQIPLSYAGTALSAASLRSHPTDAMMIMAPDTGRPSDTEGT